MLRLHRVELQHGIGKRVISGAQIAPFERVGGRFQRTGQIGIGLGESLGCLTQGLREQGALFGGKIGEFLTQLLQAIAESGGSIGQGTVVAAA